jgi:hypothetical protein
MNCLLKSIFCIRNYNLTSQINTVSIVLIILKLSPHFSAFPLSFCLNTNQTSTIFWDITPCSPLKVNPRSEEHRLHLQGRKISLPPAFTLVSCSAYSSTLKIEAICFSETSVDFQRTTRQYIPKEMLVLFIITAVRTTSPTSQTFWETIARYDLHNFWNALWRRSGQMEYPNI